jgi:rod shape-determining protein MreD
MRSFLSISMSFLFAMILVIIPMPSWLIWWRPQWVFLVLIFWVLRAPNNVGIGIAFFVGLLLDLLTGKLLGLNAFIFSLLIFLLVQFQKQWRNLPLWQQIFMIFLLTLGNLSLKYIVYGIMGTESGTWAYWWSVFSSALIWPLLYLFLRNYQYRWVR